MGRWAWVPILDQEPEQRRGTGSRRADLRAFPSCGFSISVRLGIIELFLSALDRSTTNGRPDPDEDSVSY